MNIVIIGYRCTGKSAVGKILANELKRDFVDTDHLITFQEGLEIDEIISLKGWEYFRGMEKLVIEQVSQRDNLVIATGGGVVMDEMNVANLRKKGFIIWLRADADIIRKRMEKDPGTFNARPSLTGRGAVEEIKEMLKIREPYYRNAGDIEVDAGKMSADEVADYLINRLGLSAISFQQNKSGNI